MEQFLTLFLVQSKKVIIINIYKFYPKNNLKINIVLSANNFSHLNNKKT
jgi:hypothetical protein